MLSRVERYLLRETGSAWLAVTVVLVVVLLTNRLIRFMADAASGRVPADIIFTLLGLKAVSHLGTVLPASLFLGVILALGRLQDDNELTAMTACGVGPGRYYRALAAVAIPVALLVGLCAMLLAPVAERTAELRLAEARQTMELQAVRAGRFLTMADGRVVLYANAVDDQGRLRGIFARFRENGARRVVVAESASVSREPDGARYLELHRGERLDVLDGDEGWQRLGFEQHGVLLSPPESVAPERARDMLGIAALWQAGTPGDVAELHWRLALPLAALVLVFVALPLAVGTPRQGRYGKLVLAVLIFMAYFNLLKAGQDWLAAGQVPALLGLWWVHALFVAGGLWGLITRYRLLGRARSRAASAP